MGHKKAYNWYGEYDAQVDGKGRLGIPASFWKDAKKNRETQIVVTYGHALAFLQIYPKTEWDRLVGRIAKIKNTAKKRNIMRGIISPGRACVVDQQGRFVLPQQFREALSGQENIEVILLGVLSHIELWSKENYEKQKVENINSGHLELDSLDDED